jgi:CheY-like chemotaxis protein
MDLRALVVSPDQESAALLMLILSELGIAAEHALSLQNGLDRLDAQRFEAIILDHHSDHSSDEFLRRLRQSSKNRASMLIAVVDSDFNARPLFGLGANFVLYRPLSSERTRISLRAARSLIRRERRRAPRIPLTSTVKVAYPGAPELDAILQDLSAEGTSLKTPDPLPPDCKVYFEFSLPDQGQLVRLSGEVAWQDASGRSGIRFLDVPQTSRRLMQAWLQQNASVRATQSSVGKSDAAQPFATPPRPERESNRELRPKPKETGLISNAGNRRNERRFDCKLGAEVYRLGSKVPNRCLLSDISESGCYVEMPTPFTGHSGVEIVVRTADTKVRISGQVLNIHPGFGMGVRFTFKDAEEREDVLRLLAALASGPTLDELHR